MNYDVSVIIPAYRAESFIARAVTSLTRQGPLAIQTIICADDGTDYLELLRGAGIDTSRMLLCHTPQPRSGPSVARNTALALAEADIIAPLDADDEFVEGRLPAIIGAAGSSGVATGPTVEFQNGEMARIARPPDTGSLNVDDICRLRMPFVPVFRKELAGSGWPDVSYAEDMVFNVDLSIRARHYAFVEEAAYAYHLHEGSLSNDKHTMARAKKGYKEILVYTQGTSWPLDVKQTMREVIGEDLKMIQGAVLAGTASQSGSWRDAWSAAQQDDNQHDDEKPWRLDTVMAERDRDSIPALDEEPDARPQDRPYAGPKIIARHLKTLPNAPGVYRMINTEGDVLYVGKARSLKKRVASYTRLTGHTNRIQRMIAATADMEFVTTETETEALLLEANLIKRLKPSCNVILRDDKSFPYILIARDHDAPQMLKHRGARKRKGDYYGPFASAGAVNRTINTLQRAFLLRSCTDSYYEARTRPCLLYQIKRCSAPCTGEIAVEDYNQLVDSAVDFLSGKSNQVRDHLHAIMETASQTLEFERAASCRDRLAALAQIQSHQGINPRSFMEADVFAAFTQGGQTCIQVFFFRTGQNWGNHAYFPRADKSLGSEEILDTFIAQFYDNKPVPKLILLSHDVATRKLLEEALTTRADHKVSISIPQRGEKRSIVEQCIANAREALERRLAESASQRKLLEGIAEAFGLEEAPLRIEVYDNSHIQGSNPVGGMIVTGPEGFEKNSYRKFNIRSADLTPGDDYAMMREVLMRRFSRLLRESRNDDKNAVWPDLLLIDGGAGQLSAVHEVLDELGIDTLRVVGIAKGPDRDAGRERFFIRGRTDFMLQPRDPVLYFVQRLRDEAHRFAIGAHRARRKKAIGATPLDEVPGIGPTRKRALLKFFGSAKAVSRAGLTDLKVVEGISAQMAQKIYDFFNEQN